MGSRCRVLTGSEQILEPGQVVNESWTGGRSIDSQPCLGMRPLPSALLQRWPVELQVAKRFTPEFLEAVFLHAGTGSFGHCSTPRLIAEVFLQQSFQVVIVVGHKIALLIEPKAYLGILSFLE